MPHPPQTVAAFTELPDPGHAGTLDEIAGLLRALKRWAGDPSYESIKDRVNGAWTAAGRPSRELVGKTTVVDCFRDGRRRLNADLVVAVVEALHPVPGYVTQWRQALQVVAGCTGAAAQVRVQDTLPPDLTWFAGRAAELDRLRRALRATRRDGVPAVITGMAGVGKTRLALHAGHLLAADRRVDRVLFVNLRGFDPDPAQPPADPAAVLDGFLRLLGLPGHRVPNDLGARAAAYRDRLAGSRTLVVLDDAADSDQVRPLLPADPGCPVLVTSRRSLTALRPATRLTVDAFTPDEAREFLTRAVSAVPVGPDRDAAARIARRCGHLPLALGLVAGHVHRTSGWTLTDHADRLDERHRDRRLDSEVELALDLSYRALPGDRRRLLRLAALTPGQDLDGYAAAALLGSDLRTALAHLDHLQRDHLLQQSSAGRYTLHDLVRAYAAAHSVDEDPPSARRTALTRLFDHYLAASTEAMAVRYPGQIQPAAPAPGPRPQLPVLTESAAAGVWLDAERPALVAVAGYAAANGWPAHAIGLSTVLFSHLDDGHRAAALAVHSSALDAARRTGDLAGQARALIGVGGAQIQEGRYGSAADSFSWALALFRQRGDRLGEARSLGNLGNVDARLGRYGAAAEWFTQALALFRQTGVTAGEARALTNLGAVEERLGRYVPAAGHLRQALALCRAAADPAGEADALSNLGTVEECLGRPEQALDLHESAVLRCRQIGNRPGEAWARNRLGIAYLRLGRRQEAVAAFDAAGAVFRDTGIRDGEAWVSNGLGEAASAAGDPVAARAHHSAALAIVTETGVRDQQARAHAGLGRSLTALGDAAGGRRHSELAVGLYAELGMPDPEHSANLLASSG
jgi:tetratricopeptide (TPR) repeat protein